jgi:hypothetical protein
MQSVTLLQGTLLFCNIDAFKIVKRTNIAIKKQEDKTMLHIYLAICYHFTINRRLNSKKIKQLMIAYWSVPYEPKFRN